MSVERFYSENPSIGQIPIKLLYVSTSRYENDWHSTLHSHQCTELFYITAGQGKFRVEDVIFSVSEGDMIIVNPQVLHTEMGSAAHPLEYIVLGAEIMNFLLEHSSDSRYCAFSCGSANSEIVFYMRAMLGELETQEMEYCKVSNNLLEILLVKLLRNRRFAVKIAPAIKGSKECVYIKQYIEEHYHENIKLEYLAGIAHMNKFYLVHVFTKENGISPINYLIYRRIREGCYFLKNTDHSISQISQLLGFSSPSYFSQSFRRLENTSPRKYREQCREGMETEK